MFAFSLRVIVGIGSVFAFPANSDPSHLVGDYAGWAYIRGGGDMPLRLHVRMEDDNLSVTLDVPHQKLFGLATTQTRLESGKLRFERRNSEGKLWTFEASVEGVCLRGNADLEGEPVYEFAFHRSLKPLPTIDPDRYADSRGVYRLSGDRIVVISSWFWGELLYTDTKSGRHGTLFGLSDSEFFAGSGNYVPSSAFASLRFLKSTQGHIDRLIWQEGDAPALTGERLRFVEEDVGFANGDVQLSGTLIRPYGPGPFPAIVLLGGSSWRTRVDVRNTADLFAAMGLATLIYDQRGYGRSTGKPICSFEETAADARSAVALLKRRSDIRENGIGLWGASRGGWFAPLAASKCEDVSFMILFVAPAVSPARQETTRRLNEMRAAGHNEKDIQEAAQYLELLWRASRSDEDWDRYWAARGNMEEKKWLDYLGGLESRESEDFEWDRLNMMYDPIPALEKTACPVLAFFGEEDDNVVPAENISKMEAAFKKTGNTRFTIKTLPGANHGLRVVDSASARQFHRSTGYAPELWRSIHEWLTKNAGVAED